MVATSGSPTTANHNKMASPSEPSFQLGCWRATAGATLELNPHSSGGPGSASVLRRRAGGVLREAFAYAIERHFLLQIAARGQGHLTRFLGNHDGQRIGFFGHSDGGAMARTQSSL